MTTPPPSNPHPSHPHPHPEHLHLPSLVDEVGAAGVGAPHAAARKGISGLRTMSVMDAMRRARKVAEKKMFKRVGALALVLVLVGSGAWYWVSHLERKAPDYLEAELDDVLDFTLLHDDFNRQPLATRLGLMKQLINRFKSMNADDSALMAAFAAGIRGAARDQMMHNVEKLAVDVWGDFADKYDDVKPEDKGSYLDNSFLEFTHMMEDLAGVNSNMSDADRLATAKKQAKRDQEFARKNDPGMNNRRVGEFFKFMHEKGTELSDPKERGKMARFTRDMTRQLRGQDVDTGKPK